ncbi:MAG: cupin domain-containing protein [Candidatus Bipolaricaulota bacterium]
MTYVVDAAKVEGVKRIPSRTSKVLLSEVTVGAHGFSLGQNVTDVGSQIPQHAHEVSEEGMYIVSGCGRLVTPDGEQDLVPGMAIYMPPGTPHSILNTGDEPLKLVWVYCPALPDHRKPPVS